MMFQTRSFSFTLSNPSLTALTYEWQILNKAGSVDTSGKGPDLICCAYTPRILGIRLSTCHTTALLC